MSEFVAPSAPSHWRDRQLDNQPYSPDRSGSPGEPFGAFRPNGPEYRHDEYQHPADELRSPEYTSEPYRGTEFREPEYQNGEYKWPTPAASTHQEPLSPRASASRSPIGSIPGSPRDRKQEEEDDEDMAVNMDDINEETEGVSRQTLSDRRAEKRKMKRFR
jgi:hypothetical protein